MDKIVAHPLKAFLCHASGDKPPVRELYKRLVFEGVDAWLDKEKLLPGQDWRVEIPRAVGEADVVIVFLSKKSISKEGYVQKEIKFALDIAEEKPEGTIFLIPARLEECVVPERLSRWHWVELYEEDGFIKLLRSLKLRANAVGATVETVSYEESDKEIEHRIEQLYTEGLAAFYTEEWDRACQRFQTILSEHPNHKHAAEKMAEAEKQRNLTKLYAQATQEYKDENWQVAIQSLEELLQKSAEYKDAGQLLRNARKQKQLKELYAEAKTLHTAQKWVAVLKVFEQISAIEPAYPDVDGLLPSAQKEVAEFKRVADLNELYSHAVREMDLGKWREARGLLEQVHKAQTGFLETERLLKKVENEIIKIEDIDRRKNQVNTLYEQAHGLIRSKKWRKALDKLEEIMELDEQFIDRDGIFTKAKEELEHEDKETQRQNELAAMYAEAVRLLQEEKYQEALDKWQEVKTVDPKYPDRQWVQRTARNALTKQTKPLSTKTRFVVPKSLWVGLGSVATIAIVIFAINQLGNGKNSASGAPTIVSAEAVVENASPSVPTATNISPKTNTPRPATSIPAISGYSDPTMVDEFDNTRYDGNYDTTKWGNAHDITSGSKITQEDGLLVLQQRGPKEGFGFSALSLNTGSPLPANKYSYMEIKMMVKNVANKGGFTIQFWTDKTFFGCGLDGNYGGLKKYCWREDTAGGNAKWLVGYSGSTNKWYIFTIRIDPFDKIIDFYFDGQNVVSYPLGEKETLPTGFGLGCYIVQDNDFQGYIDYVKLYTSDQ